MQLTLSILKHEIYISPYRKDKRKEDTLFQRVSSNGLDYLSKYFKFYLRLYTVTFILRKDLFINNLTNVFQLDGYCSIRIVDKFDKFMIFKIFRRENNFNARVSLNSVAFRGFYCK